jgi:hypothetical protein
LWIFGYHSEVSLSSEQHLQVVNKLCTSFEQLAPPEIPPLVHQLLQLCKNQHGVALFLRLQAYFCTRLYNRLLSTASESESTSLVANGVSIGLGKYYSLCVQFFFFFFFLASMHVSKQPMCTGKPVI